MGCDIHPVVEVLTPEGWVEATCPEQLTDRTYGRFAFLTGGLVRNYSNIPQFLPTPRGSPYAPAQLEDDSYCFGAPSDWDGHHSESFLSLAELLAVDYSATFKDDREVGSPEVTLRDFLGEGWEMILKDLQALGKPEEVRVVFDFDS